jgi:hypothetical protein
MSKFFTERTQCLYLDQFAVSRICTSSPPTEWVDVSTLIKQGVNKGRIICPNSVEQIIETTGMDKESAKFLDEESRKLSSGWCFFTEADISAHYFICKIRQVEMTKQHFIHSNTQQHVSEADVYNEISENNAIFREMMKEATAPVNIIRAAARGGARMKKNTRNSLIKIIKDKYAQEMKERLYLLGTQGRYIPRTVTSAGHTVLFWADVLCSILVRKHEMTQQETIKALDFLQDEGVDAIPSLSIRASLEAMIVYKGANETHNDQVDITRIASALPFADMMLVDGAKASDVRELELDKKFRTTIYTGQKADLINLKKHLDALINADEQHLATT